jgi:hypothetical protein
MKVLRALLGIALVCALAGTVKASGFHAVVVDPGYETYDITDPNATIDIFFSPCDYTGNQLPQGTPDGTYAGCITFDNATSGPITGLDLFIPNTVPGSAGGPDCTTDNGELLGAPVCTTTADGYFLDFAGGTPIKVGQSFTIAETGLPVTPTGGTPDIVGSATVTITPEPGSLALLLTGVLALGTAYMLRRRNLSPGAARF